MRLPLVLMLCVSASCQTQPKKPEITDAQKMRLYKAALNAQPTQRELDAARADIVKTCENAGYAIGQDKDGDPVCIEKAKEAAKK